MLYYDNLTRVRRNNEMSEWIHYFLIGVIETAGDAAQKLTDMMELKDTFERQIKSRWGNRTSNGLKVLESLFRKPFIQGKDIENVTGLTPASANQLLKLFIEDDILTQLGTRRRNRRFKFKPLLDMFED